MLLGSRDLSIRRGYPNSERVCRQGQFIFDDATICVTPNVRAFEERDDRPFTDLLLDFVDGMHRVISLKRVIMVFLHVPLCNSYATHSRRTFVSITKQNDDIP